MGKPDLIERRGRLYCGFCGKAMDDPTHQRWQCLVHQKPPRQARGQRLKYLVPAKLYDPYTQSWTPELERYLDFWIERYERALDRLIERSGDQYWAYVETVEKGRSCLAVARERGISASTVRSWKLRARRFVMQRLGDWRAWERDPRGGLDAIDLVYTQTDADYLAANAPKKEDSSGTATRTCATTDTRNSDDARS